MRMSREAVDAWWERFTPAQKKIIQSLLQMVGEMSEAQVLEITRGKKGVTIKVANRRPEGWGSN
ncbi:MAG TPA: hypothetical protein VNZ22_15165 [Bacillota bacterium]|nr:hypothetical protein [Bacillota bacterium]